MGCEGGGTRQTVLVTGGLSFQSEQLGMLHCPVA